MTDQKNMLLAIVLSALVLIGWQIFFGFPQMEKQKQVAQQQAQEHSQQPDNPAAQSGACVATPRPHAGARPPQVARASRPPRPRAVRARPRSPPRRASASRRRASPARSRSRAAASTTSAAAIPRDRRSEFTADRAARPVRQPAARSMPNSAGCRPPGTTAKLPGPDTVWRQEGTGDRSRVDHPVTLVYRQRRRPRIPPHDRGRRQVSVHHQGRRRQQERSAGHALSLRTGLAPRHAADARATTSCTRG